MKFHNILCLGGNRTHGIDGIGLHKQLRSQDIVLSTIVLTGHNDEHELLDDRESTSVVFVLKPTSPRRLLEHIEKMFAGNH